MRAGRSAPFLFLLLLSLADGYSHSALARPRLSAFPSRIAAQPLLTQGLHHSCTTPRLALPRTRPPLCSGGASEAQSSKFKLYPSRWLQLGYLSVFALLSDWVCFSVAAEPDTWRAVYGNDPATLLDIFLFTNVLFCFLEPMIVRRLGLRSVIVGAAFVMTAGCFLRSGIPLTGAEPDYLQITAGTILVGAAQPMFQCTPPLLSATWFGADERALSTAVSLSLV